MRCRISLHRIELSCVSLELDVITRGEYIEGGTEIEIIEIEGNRIVVAERNSEETA